MATKSSFLTIRVTPEARKQITREAKKEGRSVSNFLQQVIIKTLNDRTTTTEAV